MPKGKSPGQLAAYKERIRVFLAAVQAGATNRSAAAEAGISQATIHRWQHGERPFDEAMRNRLARARSIRERRWLEAIQTAATDRTFAGRAIPADPRAAQWLLERTNPEYAAVSKTEISGPGGAPLRVEQTVEHLLAVPDPDRLKKVVQLLDHAGQVPQLTTGESNGNGHTRD